MPLPDGLYDQILTHTLSALVAGSTDETHRSLQALSPAEAPTRLSELLAAQLARQLPAAARACRGPGSRAIIRN